MRALTLKGKGRVSQRLVAGSFHPPARVDDDATHTGCNEVLQNWLKYLYSISLLSASAAEATRASVGLPQSPPSMRAKHPRARSVNFVRT